jgi:hypothetical protein
MIPIRQVVAKDTTSSIAGRSEGGLATWIGLPYESPLTIRRLQQRLLRAVRRRHLEIIVSGWLDTARAQLEP